MKSGTVETLDVLLVDPVISLEVCKQDLAHF